MVQHVDSGLVRAVGAQPLGHRGREVFVGDELELQLALLALKVVSQVEVYGDEHIDLAGLDGIAVVQRIVVPAFLGLLGILGSHHLYRYLAVVAHGGTYDLGSHHEGGVADGAVYGKGYLGLCGVVLLAVVESSLGGRHGKIDAALARIGLYLLSTCGEHPSRQACE